MSFWGITLTGNVQNLRRWTAVVVWGAFMLGREKARKHGCDKMVVVALLINCNTKYNTVQTKKSCFSSL